MDGVKMLLTLCFVLFLGYLPGDGFSNGFVKFKVPTIRLCGWKGCRIRIRLPKPPTKKPKCTPTKPQAAPTPEPRHSSGLPYCKERQDIPKLLKQQSGRRKRATSWPFQCNYASIVKYQGSYQFIWPIHDCCKKCDFPSFRVCLIKSQRSKLPNWVCPSDGMHCIVKCVIKHDPNHKETKPVVLPSVVKPGISIAGGIKPLPRPKPVLKNKCEQMTTVNGKKCVRRLCVPLLKN